MVNDPWRRHRPSNLHAALLELARDRGCPLADRLPVAVIALARVGAAHGDLFAPVEPALVELAGEELVLARVDDPTDVEYVRQGGILQQVLRERIAAA